ncbi:MAG: DUF4384 domain-containing protein [Muribaculaceae bacterium]|nr:DUF4384 domain-containing protein [Muribaculaceae bacterium]
MLKHLTVIALIISAMSVFAQKIQNVSAKYTYYAPETMSIDEAKRIAIDRAKIQAIGDAFGTIVSQSNSTVISNQNGNSNTHFFSLGGSDVKGIWIADTREPVVEISYIDNTLVICAEVYGKAREQKHADLELSIKTLRNGIESEQFKDNDRLSILFQSPVKGFFSIWLADDNLKQAYCLLPYENGNGNAREIQSRKEYVLLSTADAEYPYKEETILTAEKELEINRLIFIFSTSKFSMPLTEQGEYVPELTIPKFDKWLQKNRVKDENMYVIQKIIEIRK